MKFNHTITILFLCLLSIEISAQKPQSFLGLSGGVAIPQNDFASDDTDSKESGFAKTGFGFKVTYDYRMSYNFGIAGVLIINSNPWNDEALFDGIIKDSILSNQLSISKSNWSTFGMLAGPFLYLPVNDAISIDMRMLIGFYNAFAPEIIVSGTLANGENFSLRLLKYNGIGFVWDLGTTLRVKITDKKYFIVGADYLSSTIHFKDIDRADDNGQIITESFSQQFTTISVMAGLCFTF